MNVIASKLREVSLSVLPITFLVLVLHFTIAPLGTPLLIRFLLGAVLLIIGLVSFLIGVDIGITPLGGLIGSSLAKVNKVWIILTAGLVLGFFISIAEPDLIVLANQVQAVTGGLVSSWSLLIAVSSGLAIMVSLGFLRIIYNIPLKRILLFLYLLIFGMAFLTSREFLAIAFDASGATTGIMAVPFILALSMGTSKLKKDNLASENDSFGLVAIASTGAILAVLVLGVFSRTGQFTASLEEHLTHSDDILAPFLETLPGYLVESFLGILPLVVILLLLQFFVLRLKLRDLRRLLTGFGFVYVGLILFLSGVHGGFMEVGTRIGHHLSENYGHPVLIAIGFVLGVVAILAEPAVHVLTHQIEDVTSGSVKRGAVLLPLTIGVGLAVALSVVRILVPSIQLWHYLLPGYAISLILMFFIPRLFVGIAFDAGGVATGPLTATFILAFVQGIAHSFEGADVMADGFGMIAMVAMIPILTLEILGLIYRIKSTRKGDIS